MVALRVTAGLVAAVATGLSGCSQAANTEDLQVGECLALNGTVELPEALAARVAELALQPRRAAAIRADGGAEAARIVLELVGA